MKPIKFNNNNHLPKEALILYKPKQKNNDMKSKEEILYDCTGMIAENHRTVIQAMEIHAAKVRTETIAETRSEMMEFFIWHVSDADNFFPQKNEKDELVFWDLSQDKGITFDELFSYYLTNIKGK